jgi:UDP-N-acetylmuramoyl-tripeptide--D-alanyl-D-alanine ligase
MEIPELYSLYKKFPSVQTDTRKLNPGDIFFALKGEHFNGNHFARQAVDSGATYAVIDEKDFEITGKTILVNDSLQTLQQLAAYHRKQFSIPFLAITGSNGKTTTKELIHAVLSSACKTYTTEGNLNNHIGVPLTILKIRNDAEMAVVEMGANHIGEIAFYCHIAMPTHGIITNCGKAHLEGFGSEAGVRKGKGELFDYLRSHPGAAFVMWDYDYLKNMSAGIHEIIRYGTTDADVTGNTIPGSVFLQFQIAGSKLMQKVKTQLVGDYNLPNVLAAVAVGKYFKIPDEKIKAAIENYIPSANRSQMIEKGSNKIIMDAYNANPGSMRAAIENFSHIKSDTKILLLGAMAELGETSLAEHQGVVDFLQQYNWKEVVLVGREFLKTDSPFLKFETAAQAGDWFKKHNFQNAFILVKGSRNIEMEKAVE